MSTPRRVLGMTFDDCPIFEPPGAGSSITFAAAGGDGNTVCVCVPAIHAPPVDIDRALFIGDAKNSEIASQIRSMLARSGRRVVIIDDLRRLEARLSERSPHKDPDVPRSRLTAPSARRDKETMS